MPMPIPILAFVDRSADCDKEVEGVEEIVAADAVTEDEAFNAAEELLTAVDEIEVADVAGSALKVVVIPGKETLVVTGMLALTPTPTLTGCVWAGI